MKKSTLASDRKSGSSARRAEAGAAGVEFALVFPLLLLLTFGIIELGLVFYQMNMFEKATQLGARKAVTWDPVAPELANYTAKETGLRAGQPLPVNLQLEIVCDNAACTGTGAITSPTRSAATFTAIVSEMQKVYAAIKPENVVVTYRHIGLGFVGRPGGSVVPAVTVSLRDLKYDFILLDVAITVVTAGTVSIGDIFYPSFSATLTGEDLSDGA
jgi:Flp pilus assembly protein TadG